MNTAARIGLYVAALGALFAAALGLGNVVGPIYPPGASTPMHGSR